MRNLAWDAPRVLERTSEITVHATTEADSPPPLPAQGQARPNDIPARASVVRWMEVSSGSNKRSVWLRLVRNAAPLRALYFVLCVLRFLILSELPGGLRALLPSSRPRREYHIAIYIVIPYYLRYNICARQRANTALPWNDPCGDALA
jgi:hypothetical protein